MFNMKMAVILIEADELKPVPKRMKNKLGELDIRGRSETIQISAVLKSARILKRILSLRLHGEISS